MRGEIKERWLQLCEQAVREQDSNKLMQIIEEINRLLEEKEQRLHDNDEAAKQRGAA